MKLLSLIMLLLSFAALADYHDLERFRRVQKLDYGDGMMEAGLITNGGMEVFYTIPGLYDVYIRMTTEYVEDRITVQILAEDKLISFETTSTAGAGPVRAKVQAVDKGESRGSYPEYWYNYTVTAELGETTVTLGTGVVGGPSVETPYQVTGPIEYSACDGCEHGDQLMVGMINVMGLDFGGHYVADCEGEFSPMMAQLIAPLDYLDTANGDIIGIGVPFTFVGKINLFTSDLVESLDQVWNAPAGGQLYIGRSTNLTVSRFLESLIIRTALKLGRDSFELRDDIIKDGKFALEGADVLTFTYQTVKIRTDLRTARTLP